MEKNGLGFAAILLSIVASLCLILSVTTRGSQDATTTSTESKAVQAAPVKPKVVENKVFFDRIFFHERDFYSVFSVQEDKTVTAKFFYRNEYGKVNLICDVEKGDRMWFEECKNGRWSLDANIHIHSLYDLNGAGWNHGKFGSGTTVPIE